MSLCCVCWTIKTLCSMIYECFCDAAALQFISVCCPIRFILFDIYRDRIESNRSDVALLIGQRPNLLASRESDATWFRNEAVLFSLPFRRLK